MSMDLFEAELFGNSGPYSGYEEDLSLLKVAATACSIYSPPSPSHCACNLSQDEQYTSNRLGSPNILLPSTALATRISFFAPSEYLLTSSVRMGPYLLLRMPICVKKTQVCFLLPVTFTHPHFLLHVKGQDSVCWELRCPLANGCLLLPSF